MRRLRPQFAGLIALLSLVILASFVAHAEERALAIELMSPEAATPKTHPPKPSEPPSVSPDPEEATPSEGDVAPTAPVLGPIPRDFGRCVKTPAKIVLQATMVADSVDSSRAVTLVEGHERVVKVGDDIADRTVAAIRPLWLVLVGPKGYECLRPPPRPRGSAGVDETPPPASVEAVPPPTPKVTPRYPGIRRLGKGRYAVDRALMAAKTEDLEALRREGSAAFHRRNGEIHGVRITGLRRQGLFTHLGVRRGDIITTVNGEFIDGPMKLFSLYDRLQSAGNLRLKVERNGRVVPLEFIIR